MIQMVWRMYVCMYWYTTSYRDTGVSLVYIGVAHPYEYATEPLVPIAYLLPLLCVHMRSEVAAPRARARIRLASYPRTPPNPQDGGAPG